MFTSSSKNQPCLANAHLIPCITKKLNWELQRGEKKRVFPNNFRETGDTNHISHVPHRHPSLSDCINLGLSTWEAGPNPTSQNPHTIITSGGKDSFFAGPTLNLWLEGTGPGLQGLQPSGTATAWETVELLPAPSIGCGAGLRWRKGVGKWL